MGKMSDLMIDTESERADQWIRERLSDDDLDEDSEEYQELAEEYSNYQDYLSEQAELRWLNEISSSILHKQFMCELNELKKLMISTPKNEPNYMLDKMTYAYAVTLLETFLSDTAKSLINENDDFLANSLEMKEFESTKYSLKEIKRKNFDAKSIVISKLSDISFHNITKVKKIYEIILGQKLNIEISELCLITKKRHDIVHRNGKTKDGKPIDLNIAIVIKAIENIEVFVSDLQDMINCNNDSTPTNASNAL